MRFHVLSLPHTHTTLEFSACAYTEKVRKFCIMMTDLGHEVFLYAGAKNEAPVTEHVVCMTEQDRMDFCDGSKNNAHSIVANWDINSPGWQIYNKNCIAEIGKRIQPRDFICAIAGWNQKPIADAFPANMTVEFGIGYAGVFSNYRVWESYAWMHTCLGASTGKPFDTDGRFYDQVVPGYLEMDLFPFSAEKDDYFLYIGRLIDRKGFNIAVETCKRLGKRLIVAGQGTPPDYGEYVGVVGPEERGRLMSRAQAVFVPTIYVEPFGNVAVEAQACGTPVITTDWGAMTETVIEGKTGYHCHTLREFCEAAEAVKTLDYAAIRKHAIDNYSLPVIGKKYDKYFRRLYDLWGDGWYQMEPLAG